MTSRDLSARALLGATRGILSAYRQDRCAQAAGALTFGTVLSLVPLLALFGWILGPFQVSLDPLLAPLSHYFMPTPELKDIVRINIERYTANAGRLGLLGLGLFMFVAWSMLSSIESILNDIWKIENRRGHFHRLGTFWGTLFLVAVLFAASVTLNQMLERQLILRGLMDLPFVAWILADALPFMLFLGATALTYWLFPHRAVRPGAALSGALLAGVLYQLARWIFTIYLSSIATFDRIYGLLGVIPVFLLWLFFSWSIHLLGAELACYLDLKNSPGSATRS